MRTPTRLLDNQTNCCTNCCTIASQNPLNCTKTAAQRLIFHNNIRKVGSFRNRQVSGSSPLVGSILSSPYHLFHCTLNSSWRVCLWIRKIKDALTRTCFEAALPCFNRIPFDPGADLLSSAMNLIGDSGYNSGQGCRIGFRLLMQSFRPYQTVQS
jgi:hypothetical protein